MTQDSSHSELLAGLVLGDLSCAEEGQVAAALGESVADPTTYDELEHTAGALAASLALSQDHTDMPHGLADRLNAMGRAWANSTDEDHRNANSRVTMEPKAVSLKFPTAAVTGWIAAAAAILIAATAFFGQSSTISPEGLLGKLNETEGIQRSAWIATGHPSGPQASGEVVWDPETGTGVLVFFDLAINNPQESVYQLWIFDATRPSGELPRFDDGSQLAPVLTQRPIDGGVFSVESEGRVVIPIDAKLDVEQAVAFAVTIEKPGGVVVSDRQDVPVLAILSDS